MALAGTSVAAVTDGTLANPELLTWESLTGVTPTDHLGGNTGINWTENTGALKSWELSFTLSVKSITGDSDEIFGSNGSSNAGAQGIILNVSSNGQVFLTDGRENVSNALIASSANAVEIGNGSGDYGQGVAITLSFLNYVDETTQESVGGLFTLTVGNEVVSKEVDITSNTSFLKNGNSRLWGNGSPGTQKFTGITLKQGGNMVVPEPTTATLSLLALAGLAARRRRR